MSNQVNEVIGKDNAINKTYSIAFLHSLFYDHHTLIALSSANLVRQGIDCQTFADRHLRTDNCGRTNEDGKLQTDNCGRQKNTAKLLKL